MSEGSRNPVQNKLGCLCNKKWRAELRYLANFEDAVSVVGSLCLLHSTILWDIRLSRARHREPICPMPLGHAVATRYVQCASSRAIQEWRNYFDPFPVFWEHWGRETETTSNHALCSWTRYLGHLLTSQLDALENDDRFQMWSLLRQKKIASKPSKDFAGPSHGRQARQLQSWPRWNQAHTSP